MLIPETTATANRWRKVVPRLDPKTIEPLAPEQWDDSLQRVVDDMNGRPLNVHALLANHPPLLAAWWGFRNYIVSGGSLGKRNAELVILRTACHAQSWYEWASHVVRGMDAGLSCEQVERVRTGPANGDWGTTDALILRAVDDLNGSGAIQRATFAPLVQALGHPAVLDLIAIRATYVMLADVLATYDVDLDDHVQAALPDHSVGRPFAS